MKNNFQRPEQPLKLPKLVRRKLAEGIPGGTLVAKEQYRALYLAALNLSNVVAEHVSFEEALLSQVNMSATQLEEVRFEDASLRECDLMTANWFKGGLYRTELLGCRMTGFLAGEGHFQDVLFKDCQLNLAQFRFATFRSVRFEHCDLSEADLLEADLSQITLIDCNLQNAELTGSKLRGVDLSSCNLDGARVGIQELRGATINLKQAISLVQASGIRVKLSTES